MAKILVVEDDKDLNAAYRIILEKAGHEVDSVYDGEQALQILKTIDPNIIILDLLMPIKSGNEFLKDFQKQKKRSDVKVLVFTNFDKGPEVNEAIKRGADMIVVKAWTGPQGMIQIVNNVLNDTDPETANKD